MKQYAINIVRKLKLLPLAECIRFFVVSLKNRSDNRLFLSKNDSFIAPPLWLAYDAYGHTNWKSYYESGFVHANFFSELILRNTHSNTLKVLDWGCGPGRLIRHMPKLLGSRNPLIYGCDYNHKTIDWCRSTLKTIHFEKNQLTPPLPFETQLFDVVYGLSVFTHLSEAMHFEWIQELKRILKPGGILILTTHGDIYRDKLLNHEKIVYDSHNLVAREGVKEGKRCYTTFHPPQFIKEKLFKEWTILEHITNAISHNISQDVWVLRR